VLLEPLVLPQEAQCWLLLLLLLSARGRSTELGAVVVAVIVVGCGFWFCSTFFAREKC